MGRHKSCQAPSSHPPAPAATGEFAEAIRDQFLQERVDFFKWVLSLAEPLHKGAAWWPVTPSAPPTWTHPHTPPTHTTTRALEEAVYDESGHEEECGRDHVVRALLRVDLDMSEKAAQQVRAWSSEEAGLRVCGARGAP